MDTGSAAETFRLGRLLGEAIDGPCLLLLAGDLGAGKTCLTQGLARGLEVPVGLPVTSPSYTLMNHYPGRLALYHFDLYRLAGPDDLFDLGFEEVVHGDGVTVVEWAERAGDLQEEGLAIQLLRRGEAGRHLLVDARGAPAQAVLDRLAERWQAGGRRP